MSPIRQPKNEDMDISENILNLTIHGNFNTFKRKAFNRLFYKMVNRCTFNYRKLSYIYGYNMGNVYYELKFF